MSRFQEIGQTNEFHNLKKSNKIAKIAQEEDDSLIIHVNRFRFHQRKVDSISPMAFKKKTPRKKHKISTLLTTDN